MSGDEGVPTSWHRRTASAAIHLVVVTLGITSAFHPMLSSGFRRLQTDPGDTLFNHYILEHTYRWLTQPGYAGSLWSPPFFYPEPLTLAYSENLLGTAPLYWLLRLACPPASAYGVWMIGVCVLTYLATAGALRRFGVCDLLAAVGGAVFAFGLPRAAQIGHQQLLPHLFAPLALLACWRLLECPRTRTLAGLLAACYLQLLASIYLGWFLHLALAVFVPAYLLAHPGCRFDLATFVRRRWPAVAGLSLGFALLYAVLLTPYLQANRGFARSWDECTQYIPTAADWLRPSPLSQQRAWFGVVTPTVEGERWVFPGWGVLALAIFAAVNLACRRLPAETARLTAALLGTAAVLVLLSLGDLPGGGLWRWVYHHVPGATSIRAVGRIHLTILLFVLTGGLLALDAVLRAPGEDRRLRMTVVGLVLLLGVVEQVPAGLVSFEAASFYPRAEALSRRLTRGTAAYVAGSAHEPFWTSELLTMWAGLYANRPVINGYSGRWPDGYPEQSNLPPERVFGWLATHQPSDRPWPGRLVYAVLQRDSGEYRTVLLEASRGPVAAKR